MCIRDSPSLAPKVRGSTCFFAPLFFSFRPPFSPSVFAEIGKNTSNFFPLAPLLSPSVLAQTGANTTTALQLSRVRACHERPPSAHLSARRRSCSCCPAARQTPSAKAKQGVILEQQNDKCSHEQIRGGLLGVNNVSYVAPSVPTRYSKSRKSRSMLG